jgi:hypothetical protein
VFNTGLAGDALPAAVIPVMLVASPQVTVTESCVGILSLKLADVGEIVGNVTAMTGAVVSTPRLTNSARLSKILKIFFNLSSFHLSIPDCLILTFLFLQLPDFRQARLHNKF